MSARLGEAGRPAILLGPLSLDRYIDEGLVLPGGGALNMAWAWSRSGFPFRFLSRAGEGDRRLVEAFLARHGIGVEPGLFAPGPSASIDIVTMPDRQPWMDNFVEGVWQGYGLSAAEKALVSGASRLHAVLVDPVAAAVEGLGGAGLLSGVEASGDFLSFRHYDLQRFDRTIGFLSMGFVGWPGDRDDPVLAGIGETAMRLGKLVVATLGSAGVIVFDGPSGAQAFYEVDAIPVKGTTVGCGDAFIAAFLASYWSEESAGGEGGPRPGASRADRLRAAVEAGKAAGAAATAWRRPLPDEAYDGLPRTLE